MVYIPAYITRDEICEWISYQRPSGPLWDNIMPEVFLKLMDSFVFSSLVEYGIDVGEYNGSGSHDDPLDRVNLLWAASLCYALEILCMQGIIEWSTGDVALRRLGKATHQYQRWQPMFFFAQGVSDPFMDLLPHRTYLMMSREYLKRYANKNFYDKNGVFYPGIPKVYTDDTSLGYGWNIDTDYIKDEDEISEKAFEVN